MGQGEIEATIRGGNTEGSYGKSKATDQVGVRERQENKRGGMIGNKKVVGLAEKLMVAW